MGCIIHKAYSGVYTGKWKLYRSTGDFEKFHNLKCHGFHSTHLLTNHYGCQTTDLPALYLLKPSYVKQKAASLFILTLGVVRQGEQADTGGSGPGSKHGDPARVSSECCDVLLHPAQRLDLIQQAVVPFRRLVTCAEESCGRTEREMLLRMVDNLIKRSVENWAVKMSRSKEFFLHLAMLTVFKHTGRWLDVRSCWMI